MLNDHLTECVYLVLEAANADDYIVKPVDLRELQARIKSAIRRSETQVRSAKEVGSSNNLMPFDRSIDLRISRLRRKIERNPSKPEFIRTVHGIAYVF